MTSRRTHLRATRPQSVSALVRSSLYRIIGLALAIIAIDQTSKMFALKFLQPGKSVPFIGDVLGFQLVRNNSAAFSIGNGQTWLFTIFSTLAAVAILWFAPRSKSTSWAWTAGLLLGGVCGNLIDRVTREPGFPNGNVIDFLQLPFGFPIFNLADSSIVLAMAIVMVRVLRGDKIGQ